MRNYRTTILIFIILAASSKGYCQFEIDLSNPKKVKKAADLHYEYKNYKAALPGYEYLYEKSTSNPELNLKLGVCFLYLKKSSDATMKYLNYSSSKGLPESDYYLGMLYHQLGEYDKAIEHYVKYKNTISVNDYLISDVDQLIDNSFTARELIAEPLNVNIENLGDKVNSEYADYVPALNSEEEVLYFTSRRMNGVDTLKDLYGNYFEDIYMCRRDEHGEWTKAVRLSSPINTSSHDACVGLSPDGSQLLLYKTNEDNVGGDIYYSNMENGTWSYPRPFNDHINSDGWEPSATISSNKKVLYFSSNRSGGYGGRDIYVARMLPTGKWSHAQNMGPIINTQFDEDAPFIHANDSILYFSSKGHHNMGGFDIFKSELSSDGTWGIPQNIGYPINTVDDDIYFVMSADGNRGYYSSDHKGGFGEKDIYVIHFHEADSPLTIVKGEVKDATTGQPIEAVITVQEKGAENVQGIYRSTKETGKYIAIIGTETQYEVVVEAEGYASYSEDLKISNVNKFKVVAKDYKLQLKK